MNRVLLRLLLLGAIGAVAAPGRALAQSAPAPVDKKQVAKQYVDAGLAAQDSGDYETAITFYLKAYQLVPHPTLLFNMAQAHRLAGHIDQALSLYKRYLSEDPRGAEASTARQLVSEIETRKADDARKADEARRSDEARKSDEARDARAIQVATAAPSADAAADPPVGDVRDTASRVPPQPGRLLRIAGLATGAGGAAAVAIGIGFGLHARSLSNDLSRHNAVYDPAKLRAGERANAIAIVGMAGGAALIATGAALYWWGYTQGRARERVSLAPLVLERTAGLIVSGALP
jgi:tetratricopeptide (TPR) repeat protein